MLSSVFFSLIFGFSGYDARWDPPASCELDKRVSAFDLTDFCFGVV
jgi:hypothetical protein